MPNYQKNDVRHADHKKQMSEVKRIEKLEKKVVKAVKQHGTGKKSGKPSHAKPHKKKGNKALRNVQTSGTVDERGIRVPFNEALPSLVSSSDGKLETMCRKTLNPGLSPDAGTDMKSINNGISVRTAKSAKQWLRHKPYFDRKNKSMDLTVFVKSRASKFNAGIYGVTYISSSKLPVPDTVEKLKNHAGTKWANVQENIKFTLPIMFEKNKTNKLVRATTPTGLVVDGVTDLKEAFDIDEYDWGYFLFWSQGVTGAAGTSAAVTFADPIVKGSWYLTERTDDGDTSTTILSQPRFAHFRTNVAGAHTIAIAGGAAFPIAISETNVEYIHFDLIGGTLPVTCTDPVGPQGAKFTATAPIKCVLNHSIVVRNVSGASSTVGFTVNPTKFTGFDGTLMDVLLDTATGVDAVRRWGETGNNNEMLGAVASAGATMFLDFATGESITLTFQDTALREIYVSAFGGAGVVCVAHDIIITELPSNFDVKQKPTLNEKEAEFERRLEERMKALEDRLGRPKAIAPPPLRSLSETRKQKLAKAVSGEISPTPSVVADLKGFSLFTDNKDSKDEKTSKK